MKIQKRLFRIGELASQLNIEKFVIRFWEKEFDIRSSRSSGGQRYYQEKDKERFQIIKELLYDKGFTISGAKKYLSTGKSLIETKVMGSRKTTLTITPENNRQLVSQLMGLQKKLIRLSELL